MEKSRNPVITIIRMNDTYYVKAIMENSIKKSSVLIANQQWIIWETSFYCSYMERLCVWLICGVSLHGCMEKYLLILFTCSFYFKWFRSPEKRLQADFLFLNWAHHHPHCWVCWWNIDDIHICTPNQTRRLTTWFTRIIFNFVSVKL